MKTKILYKTIKAIRFYATLFDVNTGLTYPLVTANCIAQSGYFLIRQADNDRWLVMKQVQSYKFEPYENLPYLIRLRLSTFLLRKYGNIKKIQKIVENLDI